MPVLALISALLLTRSPRLNQRSCYRYERDSVEARGQVVRRVYPGRPNYENVKRGDEPDTVYVLRLASPLCTVASAEGDGRTNVKEVQLHFSAVDALAVKAMNGKTVTIHGTLEEWSLGWHHLPILLHVRLPRTSRAA